MTHDYLRTLIGGWDVRENTRSGSLLEPLTRVLAAAWSRLRGSDATGRGRFTLGTMSPRWLEQLEHDISKHSDRR